MAGPLSGNLAELGLDDILRIIGVSRKTGIITIRSQGREAVLQCRFGLIVRATSTGFHQSLGELLVQNGAVDQATVNSALAVQQQEGFRERIGTILHNRYNLDLQIVEQSVRQQIYNVIMSLFTWNVGDFDCASKEDIDTVDSAYLDPVQLVIEQADLIERLSAGNIQQTPSTSVPARDDFTSMLSSSSAPAFERDALVVVDDDMGTARAVANSFSDDTLELFPINRSEDALLKIDSLFKSGRRQLVLIDLIMPKMDGSGVLGGLELLKILKSNFADIPVILMTDFHHTEAEAEAEALGCQCITKPRRSSLETPEFEGFIAALRVLLQKYFQS